MNHFHAGRRAVVTALLASFAATGAFAQAKYPDHPVTFVVPFAAGSATDQLARALGASISADTKAAVVVDNKAGASGMMAARVRRGPPPLLHGADHDEHDHAGHDHL